MQMYKVRRSARNRSLTVPPSIANHLPQDAMFVCELTKEGILYRGVQIQEWQQALINKAMKEQP